MTGFLVHVGASIICIHGGQVTPITSNTRVFVSGQPIVTSGDTYLVAGCSFVIPPSGPLHPCVTTQWLVPSLRITINGQPAILQDSSGLCQSADQTPQGAPIVVSTQIKASGS